MGHEHQLYLRESRARHVYVCRVCTTTIRKGNRYFRDEPFPFERLKGATVSHLCATCVLGTTGEVRLPWASAHIRRLPAARSLFGLPQNQLEFTLPTGEQGVIRPTEVRLISLDRALLPRLAEPETLHSLSPEQFEELVCDRISAMGMDVQRVGSIYQRDGGVDIIFYPRAPASIPFLGAVQAKHHRKSDRKTGVEPVQRMAGVLQSQPFHFGMVVTNTSFTADATWFAHQHQRLLRLRSLPDLQRWIRNDFADDAEWREIPKEITLAPGITIAIKPMRNALTRFRGLDG